MEKTIVLQPDRKNVSINGDLIPTRKIFDEAMSDPNNSEYLESLRKQLKQKKYLTDKQVYWLVSYWKASKGRTYNKDFDVNVDNCQGMENPFFANRNKV